MANGLKFTVQDGGLGQSGAGNANTHYIVGPSSIGPLNTPISSSSAPALNQTFGFGKGIELACLVADESGGEIVFCRAASTGGSNTAVLAVSGNTSTAVITITGTPLDDYYGLVTVNQDGSLAISLDAGRGTYATGPSSLTAGGSVALVNTGLTVAVAAGTIVAGNTFQWVSTGPTCSDAAITTAISAMLGFAGGIVDVIVANDTSASSAAALDADATTLFNASRFTRVITGARDVHSGGSSWASTSTETEATWMTSIKTDYAAFASNRVGVCAGHYNVISPITQVQYRRSLLFLAAVRDASVAIQVDLGRVSDGALSPMTLPSIPDGFVYHNESAVGGLDVARFMTATTIQLKVGLFITNPNLMTQPGSDFSDLDRAHVIDAGCTVGYLYFVDQLKSTVLVDASTGFILASQAKALETTANAILAAEITNAGAASSVTCAVSRTDNILVTNALSVTIAIVPLGKLKAINVVIRFLNPAVQPVAIAA